MLSKGMLKVALVLGVILGSLGLPTSEPSLSGTSPAKAKESLGKEIKELEKDLNKLLAKKKKKKKKHHCKKKHKKKKKKTSSSSTVQAVTKAVG